MRLVLAALGAALAIAPSSWAEPGGADEVYGPTVTQGETELELRSGFFNGGALDRAWITKAEAGHAFTTWWRPALMFEFEREPGEDAEFTAAALENVFDFVGTRSWPVHLGAYVEYEATNDGPDALELKLLAERARGPLVLRANLITERELGAGADDAWEFGYAAEAFYALNEDFSLGVQGFGDAGSSDDFGDFGDHAHYWGPVAQVELFHLGDGEVEAQVGYLVGSGEADADGQFRFKLEWEL